MIKKSPQSVPKMLIAGIAGIGKTTYEMQLADEAYKHSYQIITLDFTDEFINWTTNRSGQVFDAKELEPSDVDMDKPVIDFSLNTLESKPDKLASEIITLFRMIGSHVKKSDQQICLNIPEAEWYFSTKYSNDLKVLNSMMGLLHVLDFNQDTALMVIPMISTAFKTPKSKEYHNSVMGILNEFRLFSMFSLPSFDTKVAQKVIGNNLTDEKAKKIQNLDPYNHITVKNPRYNSTDEEKSLGLIAKLIADDMAKDDTNGLTDEDTQVLYDKIACLRIDIISGMFRKKTYDPDKIKASYAHILKNHHWDTV